MIKGVSKVDIDEKVDFAKTIKNKVLSDNWETALTDIEKKVIQVLYESRSALNLQEIRRHLIFSTIYHLINKIKELANDKERKDYLDHKSKKQMNNKIVSEFDLNKYQNWPYLDFTNNHALNFDFEINKTIQLTLREEIPKKNQDLKGIKLAGSEFQISDFLVNQTKAEELFSVVLKGLGIEIYGFKTIKDTLTNLNFLNIVLTRKPISERIKLIYFLNPIITEYYQNKRDRIKV